MADGGFWWRAVAGWGGKWWVEGGGQWAATGGINSLVFKAWSNSRLAE